MSQKIRILNLSAWKAAVYALELAQITLREKLRGVSTDRARCPTCKVSHMVFTPGRNITSEEAKEENKRKRELSALYALRAGMRGRRVDPRFFHDLRNVEKLAEFHRIYTQDQIVKGGKRAARAISKILAQGATVQESLDQVAEVKVVDDR